jgi:choline kinase
VVGTAVEAVILAAGAGRRLGQLTADRPKVLLEVGGRSLLQRQFDQLEALGIPKVTVVAGHCVELVEAAVPDGTRVLFNPDYATANNIVSLQLYLRQQPADFLLLNGDDIVHPGILALLFSAAAPATIMVDDSVPPGAEAMKVKLEAGRLVALNKTMPASEAAGEYIGLAKFTGAAVPALTAVVDTLVRAGRSDVWYETAIETLARTIPVTTVSTQGLAWAETDTLGDLAQAQSLWVAGRLD